MTNKEINSDEPVKISLFIYLSCRLSHSTQIKLHVDIYCLLVEDEHKAKQQEDEKKRIKQQSFVTTLDYSVYIFLFSCVFFFSFAAFYLLTFTLYFLVKITSGIFLCFHLENLLRLRRK